MLAKLPSVTSYRPWGFQGAFPRDFLPGSFYPQLLATMAQARLFCYPILGGACGPEAWATSVPNHDEVSGHEFLISHLLQDRLGLEEGFFRSQVLFILFSTVLYPNPFRDGEGFCAVVWIGKVEISGKARDWLGGTPTIISVFIPVGTRAPPPLPLNSPDSSQPTYCTPLPKLLFLCPLEGGGRRRSASL